MIKIIKKGARDIRECDNCGCLFSFDEEDISVDRLIKRYVKCPQCEKKIILEQIREITNVEITGMALMPDGSMEMEGLIK